MQDIVDSLPEFLASKDEVWIIHVLGCWCAQCFFSVALHGCLADSGCFFNAVVY